MSMRIANCLYLFFAGGFALFFLVVVIPPLITDPNIIGAFAAGFVNPYAAGYAMDTILCGVILSVWIIFEYKTKRVKYGLLILPLILVPGVATAFGIYLVLRGRSAA